ncbi:MAG: hypothetical protein K2K15_04035 [Anaeroplasmataceae bacterium]|nr:hypothetical protein [Anaeroplasmataceae bacterium]
MTTKTKTMTPNPNSPRFIIHQVPEYACDNSKRLSQYYILLREEILKHRWNGISETDISLTYNTYNGCTEVKIAFRDCNNHIHHFLMHLLPDNGYGDGSTVFGVVYLFEGTFDRNALVIRSFAEYLSVHLQYEGFETKLIKCDNSISIQSSIKCAYENVCKIIDITLANIKPLVWFYTEEPEIKSFDEMCYYLAGVKSRLQIECCNDRWSKVNPDCFNLEIYNDEKEVALTITYIVDDVWKLSLSVIVAQCDDYFDLFCTFNCYPERSLSSEIKRQLDVLFADFLSTLKIAQGSIYVGAGYRKDHSISIQYFYIEDTFDIFCSLLDEIVPALHSYTFQLPSQPTKLTGEIEAIKEQMEATLNTTFEVVTEEEQINKKLKCGYFQ